ncbi:zinc finger protein 260-like isoform X16 [Tribolium madens]|uniref:zinc finger protein 260-like isoform X16 n=1 Tax=Tribolium madens TaxID=41895 RepID=UPI001CF73582|nr:zinc finger protein 260-like isoform X16 [Tribolium madens]
MGSIENISELCRLCLVKDQVNVPIFEENASKEQTFVKINSCLPVKVSRDDSLPKKICDGCSCKLDMLYNFRNTSVDSEKQLLKWLNQADLSCSQSAAKDPLASTKPEIMIKQETFEPTDSRGDDNSDMGMDTHSYLMQQQKLPYPQEFEFGGPSESNVGLMTDEPAPKRAKRAAALNKAPIETDDDDLDAAMQITKAEEEDSEEIDQPDYVEAPSTSADDQPGPSGVGKASVEAPKLELVGIDIEDTSAEPLSPKQEIPFDVFTCKPCHISFEKKNDYRRHYTRYHSSTKNTCSYCHRKFKNTSALEIHLAIHPGTEKIHCDVCNLDLQTSKQLNKHKRHHKKYPGLSCCGHLFGSKQNHQTHVEKNHKTSFTCETCGKVFKVRTTYYRHVKLHLGKARCRCKICGKGYLGFRGLKYHIEVVHEGKRLLCDICGQELRSDEHLKKHIRTHTGEKPFACKTCNRCFGTESTLVLHNRTHTKEKPYVCSICNKAFTQGGALGVHIRGVHAKEKKHICVICSKGFISKSVLNNHMKVHSVKDQ